MYRSEGRQTVGKRASGTKSSSHKPLIPYHITFTVIILVAAIAAGVVVSYRIIVARIVRLSTQNMIELVEHDARSTESSIEAKWETLEGIGNNLFALDCKDTKELLLRLAGHKSFLDCIMLTLVSPTNLTASSNFVVKKDKPIATLCREGGDRFVKRIKSPRARTQGRGAELVYGVRIKGLIVENVTYTYIIARIDIDIIQNSMKTDCYKGAGHNHIIDKDGYYIVKNDRSHTPQEIDNFYQIVKSGFLVGIEQKDILKSIAIHKTFSFIWKNVALESFVISCVPMRWTDWYFITKVPMDVFVDQGKELLSVVVIFITVALMVIAFAIALMLGKTYQMIKAQNEYHLVLSSALNKADAASRAKTAFLNNMSHDIRTPMNAIIGYTALAGKHLDNPLSVGGYLDKIAQSGDYLLSLINDVLDMSRIEAGKVQLDCKHESLSNILSNIQDIVQTDIHARDIKFLVDKSGIINDNIICDKLHLNQVLLNLLSNAMKFTKAGGTINLSIKEETANSLDHAIYEFSVQDTGIGMSEEFQKVIFEPFTREATATISGIQGTGLGMAITKNLIDLMGGSIRVTSKKGEGTTFFVRLEFPLYVDNKDYNGAAAKVSETKVDFDFHGLCLLLVEDNEFNREIAFELLSEAGFIINTACNGREAVEIIREAPSNQYAAILMDVQMPVMDGLEATREIRRMGWHRPIIALTANAFEEDKKAVLDAGMNAHIEKPININALFQTLRSLVDK